MPLSPLPPPPEHSWSTAVQNAYQRLYQIYHTASSYIASEGLEAHRLQQYGQAIITDAYPLLLLMEESATSESLPQEWIDRVATEFTVLITLVDEKWAAAAEECVYLMS
jgi:hypothetical protein